MKKHIWFCIEVLVVMSLLCEVVFGDGPPLEWQKTFDRSPFDYGESVQQTSDGGYIITGITYSYGKDVYLIKTDSSGNSQWEKTFGGSYYDEGHSVQQTSDGGYIIAGDVNEYSPSGLSDVYLIKTDSSGNSQWEKTFGGSDDDDGWSVQQTSDGGYIIAGRTLSYGAGSWDVYLIKTNSSGNSQWEKTFGGTTSDTGWSVQETSDGGYIVTGSRGGSVYLIKTNSFGNTLWEKTLGGWVGYSVKETRDGGYIIAGSGGSDVYLIKTDSSGNKQWEKTFVGNGWAAGYSVQQTSDGGYIIAGTTADSYAAGSDDVYLIKTDSAGTMDWEKTFGGSDCDKGRWIQQTSDGGYIITGYSMVCNTGFSDVYLIKLGGVPDPAELLLDLAQDVIALNLQQGISNGLDGKLDAAMQALDDINENNDAAAINTLEAFINAVEAQRGNKIPEEDADALIAAVQEIIALLSAE